MLHELNKHYDTSKWAKIQDIAEFFHIKGTLIDNHKIFQTFGVKVSQGYKILKGDMCIRHNQQNVNKIWG